MRLSAPRGTTIQVRVPDPTRQGDDVATLVRYIGGDVQKPRESVMAWNAEQQAWAYDISDAETRAIPAGTYPAIVTRERDGVTIALSEFAIELRPSILAGDAMPDGRTHNERVLAGLEDGMERMANSGAAVDVQADGRTYTFETRRELSDMIARYRRLVNRERGNGGLRVLQLCS